MEDALQFEDEKKRGLVVSRVGAKRIDNFGGFELGVLGPLGRDNFQSHVTAVTPFLVTDQPDCCKAAITEFVEDDEPIGDAVAQLDGAKAAWTVPVWVLGIDLPAHLG